MTQLALECDVEVDGAGHLASSTTEGVPGQREPAAVDLNFVRLQNLAKARTARAVQVARRKAEADEAERRRPAEIRAALDDAHSEFAELRAAAVAAERTAGVLSPEADRAWNAVYRAQSNVTYLARERRRLERST